MPRRKRDNHESEEESSGSEDLTQSKKPKRRRATNASDGSNDSGFQSGQATSPVDPIQQLDLSALREFKDLPPVAGVIKQIRLKNFMCHGNLVVELDKNVNFITGRNGSGKSAILAALVLGLGGKPGTLNRGNSVKEYIRMGCNNAEISITFINTGSDSYKPKIYGKQITIERTLALAGGSRYRIKNEKGEVKAQRFDEVQAVLRAFNFQLDNPIMILTQDTSRTFLNQCNPKKLYELYYRGTQLQQMDDDFAATQQMAHVAKDQIHRRQEIFNELKSDIVELDNRISMHQEAQKKREHLKRCAHEMGWAKYRDAKKELDEYLKRVEDLERHLADATTQLDAAREFELEQDSKVDEQRHELDAIRSRVSELRTELGTVGGVLEEAQGRERQKKTACDKVTREITSLAKENGQLKAYIQSEQEKQMNDENRINRDDKTRQMEQLKERRPQLVVAMENQRQEVGQWENSLRARRDQRDTYQIELAGMTRNSQHARRQYEDLQMAQSNDLARFGRQAVQLAHLINDAVNRRLFNCPPLGPIGSHISVKDHHWALAIESCLSRNFLRSYMVNDYNDNRVLEDLMMRAGYQRNSKPSIFIRRFVDQNAGYNISRNECRSEYPNILSMLEFDDTNVKNLLIDTKHVETVILFEDEGRMRDVMKQHPPRNATSSFDKTGGQCPLRPQYRFYPCQFNSAQLLVKSLEDEMKRWQREIASLEQEIATKERERADIEQQMRAEEDQRKRCQNAVNDLNNQIRNTDRKIQTLADEINDLLPASNDIGLMENELAENEHKLATAQEALVNARQEYEQTKDTTKEAQQAFNLKKDEEKSAVSEMQRCQHRLDRAVGDRTRKKQDSDNKRAAKNALERDKGRSEEQLKQGEEKAQKVMEEAIQLHEEPIITARSLEVIDRDMRRTNNALTQFEQDNTNLGELEEQRGAKTERLNKIGEYLSETVKTYKALAYAIRVRKKGYRAIKTLTKCEICTKFVTNMSGRGYSGKLKIDEEEKQLSIFVEPREATGNTAAPDRPTPAKQAKPRGRQSQLMVDRDTNRTQDLRGLSGGERSFSTVSFILALWDNMNAPCCCLDEFDVFMDHYARRVIMELLIYFALKTRPTNQFLFFTPLSISELPFDRKGLKMLQLEAPRDQRPSNDENRP